MMDNKVLELILSSGEYTKEQREVIQYLKEARNEWYIASEMFRSVNETDLIDCAIYKEGAARSKYAYYLKQARELNIRVEYDMMVEGF